MMCGTNTGGLEFPEPYIGSTDSCTKVNTLFLRKSCQDSFATDFLNPLCHFDHIVLDKKSEKIGNRKSAHLSNTTFLVATRFFHSEWRQADICA